MDERHAHNICNKKPTKTANIDEARTNKTKYCVNEKSSESQHNFMKENTREKKNTLKT